MKRIINTSAPAVISTQYTPLTCVLSIVQVNNAPLTQAQDAVKGLWQPNRDPQNVLSAVAEPLILGTLFEAYDADTDQHITPTVSVKWYVDEKVDTWDSSNNKGKVYKTDPTESYYLETSNSLSTGRLIITKNVDHSTSVRIFCVAEYYDTTRSETYTEEAQVVLTTENKPDEFYAVDILTPSLIEYRPLTDALTTKTIKARTRLGNQVLTGDEGSSIKYFWYIDDVLITASTPGYVSGQGSDTLVVDADYLDVVQISVKIADNIEATAPNQQCTDTCSLSWVWPKIEALAFTGGSSVKAQDGSKHFESIVKMAGQAMPESKKKEFVRLNWKMKATNNSTITDLGWGDDVYIAASNLRKGASANVEVFIEPCLLGRYEEVTTASGTAVTTASGEQVFARG